MLFEQDGYKTFGEKMLVVSCCKFVTSQSLDDREHFYRGCMNNLRSFGDIHKNALFKKFCGIFKEGWYKKMKRKPEGEEKKTLTINSRVFLAIKSLTQP